jgi:hypothetical protein
MERDREGKQDPYWDDQYDNCHSQKDECEVAEWEEKKDSLEEGIEELEEKLKKQEERLEDLKLAEGVDLCVPLRLVEITEEKLEEAESNLEEHLEAREELEECKYYTYWLISEWLYNQLESTLEDPPLLQIHSLHILVDQGIGTAAEDCQVLKSYINHVSSS